MEKDPNISQQESAEQAEAPKRGKRPVHWTLGVFFAVLLTLAAWLAMIFNEYVSFFCAIAALVLSVVCVIIVPRSFLRDLAITCVIASGVLLIVYGIFYFGVSWAINQI